MAPFFSSKGAIAPRESYTSEAPKPVAAPVMPRAATLGSRDPARTFVKALQGKAEYR